jgi:hypothetical protein
MADSIETHCDMAEISLKELEMPTQIFPNLKELQVMSI